MGNAAHLLSLAGKLQSYPVVASYTEQGVVADGTNDYLDSSGVIDADSTSFLGFSSFFTSADVRQRIVSWDTTTSVVTADSGTTSGSCQPNVVVPCDNAGLNMAPAVDPALGTRIHMLYSGEQSGSNMVGTLIVWDATNGIQTATDTALSGTTFQFTTGAGSFYRILGRENNGSQRFNGTIFRTCMWTGLTIPDITSASVQNNFFSGASMVDPATSRTAYGTTNLRFDCYGNAATWNAGTMPTGTFTSNGTFVDAA